MKIILLLFTSAICFCAEQIYESGVTVSAFIGSGFSGNIDGVGEETMLSFPEGIRPWKDGSFFGDACRRPNPEFRCSGNNYEPFQSG